MRKVFLNIMILSPIVHTIYTSTDFNLVDEKYELPTSYIIDNSVENGDEILVVTCIEKTATGTGTAEKNYKLFVNEVESIAQKHNLKVNYEIIPMYSNFDRTTFNYFFKDIALMLHDGDELYFDLTFGMKPYNISMFIAVAYAVKACKNANVACAFYSQKFNGSRGPQGVSESKIYDLTGLMFLADFAANVQPGDKELADIMLKAMMPENRSEV